MQTQDDVRSLMVAPPPQHSRGSLSRVLSLRSTGEAAKEGNVSAGREVGRSGRKDVMRGALHEASRVDVYVR
jgi:hypothetical protein